MAVIEYGIILAMKKQDTKRLNLRKISITKIAMYDFEKILDKWTSYGSFVYIIIFNKYITSNLPFVFIISCSICNVIARFKMGKF